SALRVDIEMFSRGGLAVLDAIVGVGYNTLEHRPSIPKSKQATLLLRAFGLRLFSFAQPSVTATPASPTRLEIVEGGCVRPNVEKISGLPAGTTAWSYAECHRIARAARSNFYYAFYLLPKAKRDGLAALYAFMRL